MEKKLIQIADKMLSEDVPRLMSMIPQEDQAFAQTNNQMSIMGNTILGDQDDTPFKIDGTEGLNAGAGEETWIVEKSRREYDETFASLSPQNGKVTGAAAKQEMIKSKLVNSISSKSPLSIFFSSQTTFLVVSGN